MSKRQKYFSNSLEGIAVENFASFKEAASFFGVTKATLQNACSSQKGVTEKAANKIAANFAGGFDEYFVQVEPTPEVKKLAPESFLTHVFWLLQQMGYEVTKSAKRD